MLGFGVTGGWAMDARGESYSTLRDELRRLEPAFRASAAAYPGLRCQRVWDGNTVTEAGWERFADANPLPHAWQESHVLAGGDGLLRFTGDPAAFAAFTAVADGGWVVLDRLQELAEAQVTLGQSGYADGWVEAVFETAVATMTPVLRVECDRWELTEDELEELNEYDPSYWSDDGPDRYPLHPCVQTFVLDVFTSSAEAIRLWLDPDAVVSVDLRMDDLAIRLPAFASTPDSIPALTPKIVPHPDDELDTKAAAAYLGVSPDTLERYFQSRLLPRRNIAPPGSGMPRYRYRVADLMRARQQREQWATPKPPAARRRRPPPDAKPTYDHLDLD
ncbi:MAG TPA: helix-turn-helix domain-containing protein [Gemmata sp.]